MFAQTVIEELDICLRAGTFRIFQIDFDFDFLPDISNVAKLTDRSATTTNDKYILVSIAAEERPSREGVMCILYLAK